jgi:ubiquinone/menaquinone biosynthesis C-methylase UbiE
MPVISKSFRVAAAIRGTGKDSMTKDQVISHFDAHAAVRDQWLARNRYYHQQLAHQFALHIPPGRSVLEIGSGTGQLLAALQPSRGVGLDLSANMVRRAGEKYPHLQFLVGDVETLVLDEKFDYVILSDVVSYLHDVQDALHRLQRVCHPRTRIILSSYNALWHPILRVGESLGLKAWQPAVNWLGRADIENLLDLAGYEVIRHNSRVLLPVNIPLLAPLCNRWLVNLPGFRHLALVMMIVARPKPRPEAKKPTVSVIIPARNEAGNIEAAVQRTPTLGSHTEIIFVEGNSSDGTAAEIQRVIAKYPDHDLKFIPQGNGRGKGDAVRKGFAAAQGDILMILDADLTVEPEELPKFYEAIVSGHGEFVHGSRLVYPMDKQAMRFLNMLGNKFFSLAFSYLLEQRFKDTLCGTKVLYRSDYEKIAANRAYFGDFDPFGDFDLIFGAAKLNLKIVEIPIHYRERTYGTTNISRFRHGWLLLRMCCFAMRKIKFV